MSRLHFLLACLILVVALVVANGFFAEPTLTLNLKDAPLSKVLREFERQGKVRIVSNLDPSKTVTLYFDKTPVFDALETLAARADGSWRLAYLAAPKSAQIDSLLKAFSNQDTSQPSWNSYQLRGGGGMAAGSQPEMAADPRTWVWEVSPSESKELASYLAQAAQKTPAFLPSHRIGIQSSLSLRPVGRSKKRSRNWSAGPGAMSAKCFYWKDGPIGDRRAKHARNLPQRGLRGSR